MILSFDPSLTAFGWSIIDDSGTIKDCGCIETSKFTNISVTYSDTLRVTEIVSLLKSKINQYDIKLILSESPYGSKSSSAIKALSLVKGAIIGLATIESLPIIWITAGTAKLAISGSKNATKDDVLSSVITQYPSFSSFTLKMTKAKKYAIADSLSVYSAYKSTTV